MISIHLNAEHVKKAADNPFGLDPAPLYHQMRTAAALRAHPLVMNTYNTGTGKTTASLLRLFEMDGGHRDNVLFIAPTNELLHQHYEDICAFVEQYELPYRPVEVNAALLRELGGDDMVDRSGEKFVRLMRSNGQDFHAELGIDPTDHRKLPLILVTNPDLFYYAFLWQFAHHDQRNLFQQIVGNFRYVVIDEFHYYNSKQMANFLMFMALSREWGYFEQGRRICLLSATPDLKTRTYLDRLFGSDGWKLVAPHNEPPESADLQTVPTLTPLTLHLHSDTIDTYARKNGENVRGRLQAGDHGAFISNALWRINHAYSALRPVLSPDQMGRITGAQPIEQRRQDQFKPLILATPTVDIGYNFKKLAKARQNLDFVVFEARFEDEALQRMGRAGRVLGKPVVDTPSEAIALVSEDAISKLRQYDGQTVSRARFARLLQDSGALPVRDDFHGYISSGGLLENAYPIFRMQPIYPEDRASELESLFDGIKEVFVPKGGMSYQGMRFRWLRARAIDNWLREPDNWRHRSWLPTLIGDFEEWLTGERAGKESYEAHLDRLLDRSLFLNGFRRYCEMERARARAQFSFRDSFSGPVAWVYDRRRLLSGTQVTRYDVIHLVENYHLNSLDRAEFIRATGEKPSGNALCIELSAHRQERNRVRLRWQPPQILPGGWDKSQFERCFAGGKPVALAGLTVRADEPPPMDIVNALKEQDVLALLVPSRLKGALVRTIRHQSVYSRQLAVDLEDGEETYEVLLGTPSLLVAPLLHWAFQQSHESEEGIIL